MSNETPEYLLSWAKANIDQAKALIDRLDKEIKSPFDERIEDILVLLADAVGAIADSVQGAQPEGKETK